MPRVKRHKLQKKWKVKNHFLIKNLKIFPSLIAHPYTPAYLLLPLSLTLLLRNGKVAENWGRKGCVKLCRCSKNQLSFLCHRKIFFDWIKLWPTMIISLSIFFHFLLPFSHFLWKHQMTTMHHTGQLFLTAGQFLHRWSSFSNHNQSRCYNHLHILITKLSLNHSHIKIRKIKTITKLQLKIKTHYQTS